MGATVPTRADAVVIGAGPAGSAVAARLAATGRAVVLVEGGPGGPRPPSLRGLDLVAASAEPSRVVAGLAVRDRSGGPRRPYRQGWGLGGGTMINGMLLTPGDRIDYRRWETVGRCPGWGPEAIAPWLDRALADYPTVGPEPGPVSAALGRAAAADGLPVGGTSLEPDRLGVLSARLAASGNRRWSSADADLGGDGPVGREAREGTAGPAGSGPVWSVGSTTVVAGDAATRIVPRAAGSPHRVELVSGRVVATPLVVVAAGALATPVLLTRSGLGRPTIGTSLRDHPSYSFTLVLRPGSVAARDTGVPRVVSTVIRWSSGPDEPGDLQAVVLDRVGAPGPGPALAVVAVGLMATTSTGAVRPAPPGAAGAGTIGVDAVTNALATDADRRRLRAGVRRVAGWLRSPAVDDLVAEVHLDDRGTVVDWIDGLADAELDEIIAARPGPYAHPASTCPMGPEGQPGSVTSSEPGRAGELLGHPGIRVADASVFPGLLRGGLQLPVAAVARRIAADIVDRGENRPGG